MSASSGLAVAVLPSGRVLVETAAGAAAGAAVVAGPAAGRIREAFARGTAEGVLHLGLVEVQAALPPDLGFFRELGKLFVTRVCGVPDLEERRASLAIAVPRDELAALADAAPPMTGGEYVDAARLEALWAELEPALRAELAAFDGTVQEFLRGKNPAWNLVGRVCFHLAENKRDADHPFAFLATYTTRLSRDARPQHRPLGAAVKDSTRARDREALLALLAPVERAAAASALVRELVDSGEAFQPLAWTPREAHRFLRESEAIEAAGVLVRVPDWWSRRHARVEVRVAVGTAAPSVLGMEALLDFSVGAAIEGEPLSAAELREILAGTDGLALVRGRWVEVDRDKLRDVLARWKAVEATVAGEGVSFAEAVRLIAGARLGGGDAMPEPEREWSRVVAGDWLAATLARLREPGGDGADGADLRAELRPYQRVGAHWLWTLNQLRLGACLADDMGLGKTIQVLALLARLKRAGATQPHLLVVPASLIANWQAELERFAPTLRALVAHPSAIPPDELRALPRERLRGVDLVITTYGSTHRLAWLAQIDWDVVVLDEAQAIKNPSAKQTRAVKSLRARHRLALTGTPVENRLSDLWSIFDFLSPGLLGTAAEFGRFAKRLAARDHAAYAPLRALVRPYILRRMKTDRSVIADLPDKTEVKAWCGLSKVQAALYQDSVDALAAELAALDGIKRRGAILALLMRLKQICNHPSQWLGDGGWVPEHSGKLARLREIGEEIAARQDKVLVFTQFRETTGPLAAFLADVFGRPGLVLHGETPVRERRGLVDRFQQDERVPFFVLSLKAGGTGLNLTAASHVVHFDRWWNPAVEDQATDRAFRIGQKRNVLVHKFVCRGTVEEKIDALIEAKRGLAAELLAGGGETLVTEMRDEELLALVALDTRRALAEA